MTAFTLARESCEEMYDYKVAISQFDNGVEQRRLLHENPLIGFRITSPILSYTKLQQYRNHLISAYGALNSFEFTSPFDNETHTVRYEVGSFRTTFRAGVYQARFNFDKVVS